MTSRYSPDFWRALAQPRTRARQEAVLRRIHMTNEGRQAGNDPVRRHVRRPNGPRASRDRMGHHPPRVHGHHEVGLVRRPIPGHDVGRSDGADAAHADDARPRLPTFGIRRFPAIVTGFAAIAAAREGLWCPVGTQDRAPLADGHAAGHPGPLHEAHAEPPTRTHCDHCVYTLGPWPQRQKTKTRMGKVVSV